MTVGFNEINLCAGASADVVRIAVELVAAARPLLTRILAVLAHSHEVHCGIAVACGIRNVDGKREGAVEELEIQHVLPRY